MFSLMYLVAIVSGLAAQYVADTFTFQPYSQGSSFYVGGYTCPFDLAIICLFVGMILIATLWEENYGSKEDSSSGMIENLSTSLTLLRTDRKMVLLAVVVSCFEGSMFAFVFNWTPALDSKVVPPPHGVIFAIFMMACMCGASVATIVGDALKPSMRLMVTFSIGIGSFGIMSGVAGNGNLGTCFVAFCLFEFCCGLYFPSIGVLKSEVVPENVRTTMYNIYRIPLNAMVVGLLLSNVSMVQCFVFRGILLTFAFVSIGAIHVTSPKSKEELQGKAKPSKEQA